MPDYVQPTSPGYVPPEAAPERTVTEADRAAAVAAPTTDAPLFGAYQPPPARVRRASGLGLALLGLLALALIGAVFIFARFLGNRTGSQQAAPPTAAPTPTPNVGPQSPPAGMVYVPGGAFKMGRNDGDDYEKPAHDVTVRPFFMDIYEVTNEDYAKFVAATQHKPPPGWKNGAFPEGAGRKPVTGVNFDDAGAYAAWAGKRLPTEEEWEFAARGADGRLYPWGGDKWDSKTRANANAATRPPGLAEIGAYPDGASPYGVQDLAGNAWEWTSSPLKAYEGGELPEAPAADAIIIRGGCYLSGLDGAAVTYRGWVRKTAEKSYAQTGIRCVKDLP
jgi:formylglycine-generating enzyme required for sulfatase activity